MKRQCKAPEQCGVDVGAPETRSLVRRLLRRYKRTLRGASIEREDAEQEVYATIMRRNASEKGRWDKAKGGLCTYLYAVVRTTVSHMMEQRSSRHWEAPHQRRDAAQISCACAPAADDLDVLEAKEQLDALPELTAPVPPKRRARTRARRELA